MMEMNIKKLSIIGEKIVCLCGSTQFMVDFHKANWEFTLKGWIVLSVGVCKHAERHGGEALGKDVADMLDELHLRKIDKADLVYVLNVNGYIGVSTAKEIAYAEEIGASVQYLEDPPEMLTLEKLKTMEPGTHFASGEAFDVSDELFMANTGKFLTWVAVRGHGKYDWAIYTHIASHDKEWIAQQGDKVGMKENIKFCVPCDDQAYKAYRL